MHSVCALTGPPEARQLAAVSKALANAVAEAWLDLQKQFPCRLYVIGGVDGEFRPLASVERFDPLVGSWETLPSIESPCAAASAAVLGGRLYVLGGEVQGRSLRDCQRFDPTLGIWESMPPLQVGRVRPGLVVTGGQLWALGGLDGARPLRSVERFDPHSRRWEFMPEMQRPRYACCAAVLGGTIFAIGGELTHAGVTHTAERFDEKWRLLPAVPALRCAATLAVAAGALFSVGGLNPSGQAVGSTERMALEVFTSDMPTWEAMPAMPTARQAVSAAGFGGRLCVVGGKGATFEAVCQVEVFDPELRSWVSLPPLPVARLRAAVAGGHI